MPSRIVRDGILTSERVDALGESAELLYRRLLSVVDDHGRYPAHPTRLRTSCYPMRIDRYTDEQVLAWRRECEAAGLVTVYVVGRVEYLQVEDFRQQVKSKSKYPSPQDGVSVLPRTTPDRDPNESLRDPVPARTPTVHDPTTVRAQPVHDPCTLVVSRESRVGVESRESSSRVRATPTDDDDGLQPKDWAEWSAWWRGERGIEVPPGDVRERKRFVPLADRWVAAGVTCGQMRRALQHAEREATEPIAYLPAYVDRVLANQQAPPRPAKPTRTSEFMAAVTGRPATAPPEVIDVQATAVTAATRRLGA